MEARGPGLPPRGRKDVPFIVTGDGNGNYPGFPGFESVVFPAIDNLIREGRIPPMVAITIENGGQDAQGSQRGFEYDSVNGLYAEFVETEVLPLVEKVAGIRLTTDPAGRIVMGGSASGEAVFTMAWFHPELFGKVLAYSPTFTNQQWPHNPNLPGGAWEYHSRYAGPLPNPLLETEGLDFSPPGPKPSTQPAGSPLIPQQSQEAYPGVVRGGRPRPLVSQSDGGRDARLCARLREHGQGAGRERVRVPVHLRPQCGAYGLSHPLAVAAACHRVFDARISSGWRRGLGPKVEK